MSDTNWQLKEGDQFESRRMLSLQIANDVKPRMVGGFIAAPDTQACYQAAGHIEAQQQRIEALEGDNRTLILAGNIDSVLIAKLERDIAEAKEDLEDADRDVEIQCRWKREAQKKAALYEHVRTLNPREFGDIWRMNLIGGVRFDDLILADMDKRKEQA